MANADISLLFGVLGEGSLSGESGSLIQSQLSQIMAALNKTPLKVKVGLDTETGGQKSWSSQLQTKLNTISSSGKFSVQVSKLTLGAGAITDFRKQLSAVVNTLNLDKGVSVTIAAEEIGEIKTKFQDAGTAATDAARKVAEFKVQIEALSKQKTNVSKLLNTLNNMGATDEERAKIAELNAQYEQWAIKIETIRASKSAASGDTQAALINEGISIRDNIAAYIESMEAAATAAAQKETAAQTAQVSNKKEQSDAAELNNLYKQIETTIIRIKKAQQNWNAAENGRTSAEYAKLDGYIRSLQNLEAEFNNLSKAQIKERLSNINKEFATSSTVISNAGEATKTLSSRVSGLANKFASWLTVSQVIMLAYRGLRQMVSAVIDVDTAMTELRKVTEETESTYSKFLENSISRAKVLGATVADVVTASADFARLGYTINEASQLADAAIVYKNVGDGIEDISEASESIISTMKAFGVEAESAMFIVDKFNEIGNNFAISSKGVGDALLRSASALAAGNNTLDESIALITAANSSVQDADVVGTTMKTVSMYLRAAKTEAEEAGESTEGMANSVSELREELLALTGGKVDVQIDENNFKSTYQIMKELADVWGELTDISQANILEMIGGKRNANVVMSLIENFAVAEDVIKTSAEAAGSALAENEKYLDSIEGKISEFKATFQELAVTLIDSEFVKQIVELGTGILGILTGVAKVIDAIGGLNTVLFVTVGLLATIKAQSIISFLSKVIKPIKSLITIVDALASGMVATNISGSGMGKTLSIAFGEITVSATAAQIAVGAFVAVLGIALLVYNNYKRAQEEARQAAIDAANAAIDESNEISELTSKYLELNEAIKEDASVSEDLTSAKNELLDKLDTESDRVKELAGDYADLTDKIKAAAVVNLQDAERDIRGGIDALMEDLLDAAEPHSLAEKSLNHIITTWDKNDTETNHTGLQALVDAGYISSGSYGSLGMELWLPEDGYDLSSVEGITAAHKRLAEMLDIVQDAAGSDNEVWSALYDEYNRVTDALNDYDNSINSLNDNLAEQYMLQGLIGQEVPTSQDGFDSYRQGVIDAAINSGEFIGSSEEIESAVDRVLGSQAQFADFYQTAVDDTANGSSIYAASLSDLAETVSSMQSAYDLLNTAMDEMADGGLSADTVKALAEAEKDYIDYLYEENGLIKLNTDAWAENANAKMRSEMADIQKEIDSLEEQNKLLQEKAYYYLEQRAIASDGGIWNNLYTDTTKAIEENNDSIAENQRLLAVYGSLYSSITGDVDAYTSALNNFSNVANTIDSVSDSFQTLADLQAQVAKGFTMSLDKALEFASVYPEILNNAQVSADGQLILNENVVNSFIDGKKAELDAQIDSEIAQLEADKAVLEGKMAKAQAELELAKSVGEGEGQISKEVAEYRLNVGNALTAALIDMGVDEADAYKLAAAAMAEDEEEFARVAKECFENLDENSAKAAYNMAHSIFVNAQNSSTSIADIAKQAHQTARAIAAMGDGKVAGSEVSTFNGSDGTNGSGLSLDLYEGTFNGSNYEYEAKSIDLDDYISQIELDISSYQDAIAQIDGQIATLQALKNLPLKSFKSDSSGSSSSKTNEIEEYIADIDEYYDALKRLESIQMRLSKLQTDIEYADTEQEKLALTKQLIAVYNDEADALEHLNELRQKTIENGANELRSLGFNVSYNAATNELYIANLEHLNELQATTVGEYDSLLEATNAFREQTESLIDTMEELNSANQDGSDSLLQLRSDIKGAKQALVDYLNEIVQAASDVVDTFQNVYDTLHQAADEYASGGYVTIDTLQSIISMGTEYMQYLMDENGQLVINEERINAVIAAKTQQLALENAMSYVERIRLALSKDSLEDLNQLLFATTETTNATWGLVYAELALMHQTGDLNDAQYGAALHNIQALQSLANNAINGIGEIADSTLTELNSMKDGLDDILKYVMDMLKQRIQDQIDALEDMKDAYRDIIDLRKEALDAAKEEADYQDEVAKKVKEIAKLQERINALSLDDSRDAQSQKAKLEEEMYELQNELADKQSDYAVDAQKEALDNMADAYEQEKDKEIEILEDSISSYQKLYDMAIAYIESNWDSLYSELISWNTQYGTELNSTITTAWENALTAAQRYGSYVSALNSIEADINSASGNSHNDNLGDISSNSSYSNEEAIHSIIKEMYANSNAHHTADAEGKAYLNKRNLTLGAMLAQYGITAIRGDDGVWYVDEVGGEQLYKKYKQYIYHKGGVAGDEPTLKQNEILSVLEKGEVILDAKKESGLFRLIDFMTVLSDKFDKLIDTNGYSNVFGGSLNNTPKAGDLVPINESQNQSVQFGDVYIYGTPEETVEKHREINREFTNEVLKQLNIKR